MFSKSFKRLSPQVEETVYDDKVKCQHTFTDKCHDSYITDFVPTQERKCETSYNKKCRITYTPQVHARLYTGPTGRYPPLCNFMAFLNDKCGHGVGAEYMVDPQNN